jgi:hypothetical protein
LKKRGAAMLKKISASLVLILTVLALSSAASDFRSADYQVAEINLTGEGGASGVAIFRAEGFMPMEYSLGLTVYGLKPNSVYSVWLTDGYGTEGREALGIKTNHFKTNGSGTGRYVTNVSHLKVRHWRSIEVYYHPDNDPQNTKDITSALKGRLRFY